MRIKSMTATFGKLEKAHLELEEGLNLIYAPNEGGKSTWCAFWRAMLYGVDTRDRDRKGYLADKNRYQPWSGSPMEGEVSLEWQGRDITLRRGPRGSVPFGAFSAVYTGTEEPVPGLTAGTCGPLLTGAGREVFERSAFLGGGELAVTAAPELEKRIAALVSSGEEEVSFSQAVGRLREWRNRRQVNKSVGLIPKLEGELAQVNALLADLEAVSAELARLEGERAALEGEAAGLSAEEEIHRRLAQRELNRRYAQAGEELESARAQLTALEGEAAKYGPLPDRELVKRAQGELQYLKVLDEEIRQGEEALLEAEAACAQAQAAVGEGPFAGAAGEEALLRAEEAQNAYRSLQVRAHKKKRRFLLAQLLGFALAAAGFVAEWQQLHWAAGGSNPFIDLGLAGYALCAVLSLVFLGGGRTARASAAHVLERYGVKSPEDIAALARDHRARCAAAEEAARQARTVRDALRDRQARRESSRADLLAFVHSFAPQASDLFGCSAALSRALNLDHELALARARTEERRRRREDLAAQGGREHDTLELLHTPARTREETQRALAAASARLEQVSQKLNQARGRQSAMGDPAALAARREQLEGELERRREEHAALTAALEALEEANARLQERFSPELNRLAGQYLARLTGGAYTTLALNRELEGMAARAGDVLPRSALYLSRGTADQLYLALRLAVCRLCLPERPPLVLDDALAAFDDSRLRLALELLRELAREQQVLLFTCQNREGEALRGSPGVARPAL